ncbi:MAG: hypothetical protein JWM53_3022 [bacterium]|nr:hypothetical protein [bacterium]
MGLLNPNYDAYPGLPPAGGPPTTGVTYGGSVSDSGLPGSTDNPANWIDNTIGPTYVDYPLPVSIIYSKPSPTTPGGTGGSPSGSSPPAMALELRLVGGGGAGAPVQVRVAPPSNDGGASGSGAQAASASGAPATSVSTTLQRAYCLNPAFHGERSERKAAAEEHVTHEAQPVLFTVPSGCNAVDLWFGPIEPTMGAKPHDFQHVIQTGKARVVDADSRAELDEATLSAGQHVAVIVPWRAAPSAKIEAGRLRMAVIAHFYAVAAGGPPSAA